MEITDLKVPLLIILVSIPFLWLFFKALKLLWTLMVLSAVLIVLVFAVPALREWVFHFFNIAAAMPFFLP
jgi:hypothetical protein